MTICAVDIESYDPNLKELGPGDIRKDGCILGVGMYCPDRGIEGYFDVGEDIVKDILADEDVLKVFHNAVYDTNWLVNGYGLVINNVDDTMTRETLLDAYAYSYSLEACCARWKIEGKNKGDTIDKYWTGKGKAIQNLHKIPRDIVAKYCIQDCVATYNLWHAQEPQIQAQGLVDANNIERRLYPVLWMMRKNGIRVDWRYRDKLSKELNAELDTGIAELEEKYGITELSFNKATHMEKMWRAEGIPIQYTPTGRPSFTKEILANTNHPLAQRILRLKKVDKLLGTFIDGSLITNEHNGRIHCVFYPAKRDDGGTVTGRWSSQHVNMQQQPREGWYRSMFLPEEDCYLGAFDYKQIEYRVFAHFAQGPGSDEVKYRYNNDPGTDYHQMTVDIMGWNDMGKHGRILAKNFSFTCCSPDSFFATKRGYIRARDLRNDDLLVLDSGKWRAFIGRKPQYRFTLSNGQQFCVTTDHPFKLFGEEVGACNIKVGDRWDVVPNRYWGDYQVMESTYPYHHGVAKWEQVLNEDWAYLIGVWLGNGSLHYQYKTGRPASVSFTTHPETTQHIKDIIGGRTTVAKKAEKFETWVRTHAGIAYWFFNNCGVTADKHVPDIIYRSPRSVMVAFMRGFLDSDGTVTGNKAQLINANEQLIRGLARCAAMLGWSAYLCSEAYDTLGCTGTLYRLVFHKLQSTCNELQGIKRKWTCKCDRWVIPDVTVVSKEEIGEQDTFCIELPPPHWYEAECCVNHNSLYGLGLNSFVLRFAPDILHSHPELDPDDEPAIRATAERLRNEYFARVPFVKTTCDLITAVAKRRGYVTTVAGRRQRMPKDKAAYKLINYLIQGSAADVLKKGMVDAYEAGVFDVLKPHLSVHDEVVFSIPKTDEGRKALLKMQECMENAYKLDVPISIDTEIGTNWGNCSEDTYKEFMDA